MPDSRTLPIFARKITKQCDMLPILRKKCNTKTKCKIFHGVTGSPAICLTSVGHSILCKYWIKGDEINFWVSDTDKLWRNMVYWICYNKIRVLPVFPNVNIWILACSCYLWWILWLQWGQHLTCEKWQIKK